MMMCRFNRGDGSARFGILLLFIGGLWFAQRVEWFPSHLFGPLVVLVVGVWLVVVSILARPSSSGEGGG